MWIFVTNFPTLSLVSNFVQIVQFVRKSKIRLAHEKLKSFQNLPLIFCKVLVNPEMTSENLNWEICIRLSLFCWTLIREWYVWGPMRHGNCSSNLVSKDETHQTGLATAIFMTWGPPKNWKRRSKERCSSLHFSLAFLCSSLFIHSWFWSATSSEAFEAFAPSFCK